MSSCILPQKLEEYRKAWKNKDLDMAKLVKMSTEDRTALFKKYAGADAKKMNTLFEEKLVLKDKVAGLKNFYNKTAEKGRYGVIKKEQIAQEISRYKAMQQERILTPKEHQTYLNDLADRIAGTHIPKEVAQKLAELTSEVSKSKESTPTSLGVSDEYFKAKDNLNSFMEAQKPLDVRQSIAKNIAIIGRNNLILGASTPLKTSIGQATNSALDMLSRRLGTGEFTGANPELKGEVYKEVQKTFKDTGRNGLGMESLDDAHMLGFGKKAEDFSLPSEGNLAKKNDLSLGEKVEKGIAKTAEISQHITITLEHQIPFTKFYQKAWLDMADLMSTKLAKSEGLQEDEVKDRAAEIFKDAVRIEPQTEEGKALRKACQAQAARVTSTNDNFLARYSLGIKKVLNNMIPMGEGKHFPLGDFIEPMAKIPATVISNSIENAGVGIPFGLRDIMQGKEKIGSDDLNTRLEGLSQYAKGIQKLARIAGSITIGAIIVNSIDKKDLREDKYGNKFFRLGSTWINTEYLSFVSASMGGMIEMKEGKAKTALGKAGEYVSGSVKGLASLPGSEEVKNVVEAMSSSNFVNGIKRYASEFATSRAIPAAVRDIFKHAEAMPWFGPNTRPVDRLFFGAHGIESTEDVRQDKLEQKQHARERKAESRRE